VKPLAVKTDGVQTQVDQNAHIVRGHHDVSMRQQLQDLAADRSDRVDDPARRIDCRAVAHHAWEKHRVRHIMQRNGTPSTGARTSVVLLS